MHRFEAAKTLVAMRVWTRGLVVWLTLAAGSMREGGYSGRMESRPRSLFLHQNNVGLRSSCYPGPSGKCGAGSLLLYLHGYERAYPQSRVDVRPDTSSAFRGRRVIVRADPARAAILQSGSRFSLSGWDRYELSAMVG